MHTVEAKVGALLDLEQYTRKVTREDKAAYGLALGRAGAKGAREHEKPGGNLYCGRKRKVLEYEGVMAIFWRTSRTGGGFRDGGGGWCLSSSGACLNLIVPGEPRWAQEHGLLGAEL